MRTLKVTPYNKKFTDTLSILVPSSTNYVVGLKYTVDDQDGDGLFSGLLLAKEEIDIYKVGDVKSYLIFGCDSKSFTNSVKFMYPDVKQFTHLVFQVPYKKPSIYEEDALLLNRFQTRP